MTILLFILVLSILIIVHEGGHFFAARRVGVKVDQFAVGFGPKVWSWVVQGTEYCLCAIPLGGFVKMAGDERPQSKGKADEYFSKTLGERSQIIVMGPIVNYILAYLCFVVVFMLGCPDMEAANKSLPAQVGTVVAGTPAQKAGLLPGDLILSVDGQKVSGWGEMQEKISTAKGKSLAIVLERGGKVQDFVLGFQITKDIFGREHAVKRIDVQSVSSKTPEKLPIRQYGFFRSFVEGGRELWMVTTKTYTALWEIVTGQRSAKEGVTGLVGMFFVIQYAAAQGIAFLLYVVGVISASLAIFNLLPVIPLDGGHLFLIGLEKVRGKPLSLKVEDAIAKTGFVAIMILAAFVFYVDFERIGWIEKVVHFFNR